MNGDDDASTFIQFEGLGTLSRAAFQLHSYGIMNSIKDGHPGFVSDDYLNAIEAETTTAALELEAAGIWQRRGGGYFVVADDMVRWAIDANERFDRLADECLERGRHLPDPPTFEAEWVSCSHCLAPLKRSDGGPVAPLDGRPVPRP